MIFLKILLWFLLIPIAICALVSGAGILFAPGMLLKIQFIALFVTLCGQGAFAVMCLGWLKEDL